ncbi:MAG: hypothetical protein B6A08_18240 [Sorangiineae bacterium NIC37A_2]|nr:MAG: hypothetical protein B6A08_18240 [Sorangiineae bacterium NIC37A_2]
MSQPPVALARGVLETTPLPEFLIHAFDRQYDGTLVLQSKNGEKNALMFVRGAPAKARLTSTNIFLSQVLADLGLVRRELAESTQAECAALGLTHGQLLKQRGLIDDAGLYIAVREQLQRQVLALCDLPPDTDFGFFGENFLAGYGPEGQWRVKPLPLIWRALVDHLPAARVAQIAAKIQTFPLKMRVEAPVARYHLKPNELSLVNLLRARPQPLEFLTECGVGTPEMVRRVAVALLLSRQLEGINDAREPVGLREPPESPSSLMPPPTDVATRNVPAPRDKMSSLPTSWPTVTPAPERVDAKQLDEFRREIEALTENPPATYYDVLGVPLNADPNTVRAEFFRLAKRWHPDKLPDELQSYRSAVTQIFARMSEAHQVLTDASRRADYDRRLNEAPDSEQRKVTQILEAVSAFQRAEVLFKKKDYPRALEEAKRAFEGDSTQADHVALYAHLLSLQNSDSTYALSLLDRAVEMDNNNVKALWYRAQLNKKLGRQAQAVRDYRTIVELRPHHVEAQRELRLYEMRRRTGPSGPDSARSSSQRPSRLSNTPPESGKGGLFGRFLKK